MIITYTLVNEIFKTLPVGYYLGRRITHTLDEHCTASYFNPVKDEIVVSYPMIAQALSNVVCSKEELEEMVRTILYHEISHVILTPDMKMNRVINIVEDERIETIFRTYYMNTNFRKTIKLINNYHGEAPTDKDGAFYQLVRYRVGEDEWLKKLVKLLNAHKNLTSRHSAYNYNTCSYYDDDIMAFYREFCNEWEMNNSNNGRENNDSSENSNNDNNTDTTNVPNDIDMDNTEDNSEGSEFSSPSEQLEDMEENKDSTDDNIEDENQDNESNNANDLNKTTTPDNNDGSNEANNDTEKNNESDFEEDIFDAKSIIEEAINNIINVYNNENLTSTLKNVVDRKLKQNKKNGAAISSYSGQLNKRAVATRDDYRWWTAQNREGNIRRYANVHFNLYIDNSGSFKDNDKAMNTFIRSLDKISKTTPQFTFDIITINNHEVEEWVGHDKEFQSYGGSALFNSIADVIKRHDKRNAEVYSIVMFDGDIHYHDNTRPGDSSDALRHFNRQNTIIISDNENQVYLDAIKMNKAKVKYVKNYCEEFINTIITLLEKTI